MMSGIVASANDMSIAYLIGPSHVVSGVCCTLPLRMLWVKAEQLSLTRCADGGEVSVGAARLQAWATH